MNATTLARWQFASTTLYHYLIVPLTIGLTVLVAIMQTNAYLKRGRPSGQAWDRASRYWGRIMLTLLALGVVTGIVQEFQFGMNWSVYSRFVGDIFGAPLAMEALVAFFLESTFIGLWIFGRGLLSPRVHLATIWLAAIGSALSAYFILAANSFMQHPVGLRVAGNRLELTSIWKVLTNSTQLVTFPHVILSAFLTAGAILVSVSAWHLRRGGEHSDPVHRKVAALGLGFVLFAGIGASIVGHVQGQIMTDQQPMKMAAAEALWDGKSNAPFSLFAYGDVSQGHNKVDLSVPDGLSILAKNRPGAYVAGINDVQAQEVARYGPGNYKPIIGLAYWCFRLMIGFGGLAALLALVMIIQWRRGRLTRSRRMLHLATWVVVLPLLANSAGWLFTENGRQPWLVYGLLKTSAGVSTNVSGGFVAATLIGFTLLYGVLGVVCFRITKRIAQGGPDPDSATTEGNDGDGLGLGLV